MPHFELSLFATAAMAIACAVLSVFVVARRWAFLGEGISHSGFGGAGLAWIILLLVPASASLAWLPYAAVVVFCLSTALTIGYLSHGDRLTSDAAIGIFLVASLAFGFLAREIFRHVRGVDPIGFDSLLFGQLSGLTVDMAIAAVTISAAVVVAVAALGKEILAYCFDPLMAQASGVRAGMIHYLLMILVALTIIIGMPITGSVLVTALLVLPGVNGNLLSRRFRVVVVLSICFALLAAVVGVILNAKWRWIPTGPAIVLTLFVEFLAAYAVSGLQRKVA